MAKIYTQKQIEKYKRQKYISALNKCTKNLYKIFRDKSSTYDIYKTKFKALKDEIDKYDSIRLNSEHSKLTKEYINNLYNQTVNNQEFSEDDFLEIKEAQLTKLNRLQKLKNKTKYSKGKYKNSYLEN